MILPKEKGAMEHLENNKNNLVKNIIGKIKALLLDGEKWSGLGVRVISGSILATLVLGVLWIGGFIFSIIVLLAALQMLREWDRLTEKESSLWGVAGLFYIAIPCAAILYMRNIQIEGTEHAGLSMVLYVLFAVWATDIGAYFTGRIVGGAKLAPTISPSKTWAGLGGGMTAAGVVGGISHIFSPYPTTLLGAIMLGVVLAAVAQGGDLFESWLKRRAGVKDSSTLIPGHGGLLDRVDGLMFTIPLFALLVCVFSLSRA